LVAYREERQFVGQTELIKSDIYYLAGTLYRRSGKTSITPVAAKFPSCGETFGLAAEDMCPGEEATPRLMQNAEMPAVDINLACIQRSHVRYNLSKSRFYATQICIE
jgi:hypothetical protein